MPRKKPVIEEVSDQEMANKFEATKEEVVEATQVAAAAAKNEDPLPLTPDALKYLDENWRMKKLFTEDNFRDRSNFLNRSLTAEDMKEIFGLDKSMPEDKTCSIPKCTNSLAPVAYRAVMIVTKDNEQRSNGKVKAGELMTERTTGETIQRGLAVAHKQSSGFLKPEAFCIKHLSDGRKRPDLEKKLPAQIWEQALERSKAINSNNAKRAVEENENVSEFYGSLNAKSFGNSPRFGGKGRGQQVS